MIGWIFLTKDGEMVHDNNGLLNVYPSKERALLNKQPEFLVVPVSIEVESEMVMVEQEALCTGSPQKK
jgi:hypothetical protein